MTRIGLLVTLALLASACSASSEQECRAACDNVVKLTAQSVEQLDEAEAAKLVEEAKDQLTPCVQACLKGDPARTRCLAEATTIKIARECAPEQR